MWLCRAYKNGRFVAEGYEDNKEWFKSKYSDCNYFKFDRIY